MAADELAVCTSVKFILAAKSCVSGTNTVTFAVAWVAVDPGDPDPTREPVDALEEPNDTGMAVDHQEPDDTGIAVRLEEPACSVMGMDLVEPVMDAAGVVFFFAPRRSWCVADLFLGVCGCLLFRVPTMLLVVQ